MRHLDLFSGIGGFALAASWVWGAEHEIVCFCEKDTFCQKVLKKHWPDVPIVEDVRDLCVQKLNKLHQREICKKQNCSPCQPGSRLRVKNAEQPSSCHQAEPKGDSFVRGIVECNTCGGQMEQMRVAGNGCGATGTPIGRTVKGINGDEIISKQRYSNGDEECSRETPIPVSAAEFDQSDTTFLEPITLNIGPSRQGSASRSQMESRYARTATTWNTGLSRPIDLLTAGWPCPPVSCAGKRKGKDDERWLWPETLRVISETRPTWCVLENVPGLLSIDGGVLFESVCSSLEDAGYEVQPFIIPAAGVGAPHRRDRVWIMAKRVNWHSGCERRQQDSRSTHGHESQNERWATTSTDQSECADKNALHHKVNDQRPGLRQDEPGWPRGQRLGDADCDAADTSGPRQPHRVSRQIGETWSRERGNGCQEHSWDEHWSTVAARTCVRGVDARVSNRVDRLRALGNSIVPQVVVPIFQAIKTARERGADEDLSV